MPNVGFKHSEETKRKMSLAGKNRVFTKARNAKISKALKGRVFTEDWKRKISEAKKGVKHKKPRSIETRKKLSQALMGHKLSPESKEKISKANNRPETWNKARSSHLQSKINPQILERDGHCCKNNDCDGGQKRLGVHHIDHNPTNHTKSNLITLCLRCHRRHHSKIGFYIILGNYKINPNGTKIIPIMGD